MARRFIRKHEDGLHYASTPTLYMSTSNHSDGEETSSSTSSSSSSPYTISNTWIQRSSSTYLNDIHPRLLGIKEEGGGGEEEEEYDESLTVSERDIFSVRTAFKGHKTQIYVCSTMANLYSCPRFSTKTDHRIHADHWNLKYTGIPILLLDPGNTRSRRERRIQIFLVEKGSCFALWRDVIDHLSKYRCHDDGLFHTLHLSTDHSVRIGLSFESVQGGYEFYSKVMTLTSDPQNISLSGPMETGNNSYSRRLQRRTADNNRNKRVKKTEISTPCGFQHLVSIGIEDSSHYFSVQSYVGNSNKNSEKRTEEQEERNNQVPKHTRRKKRQAPQLPRAVSVPEITKL